MNQHFLNNILRELKISSKSFASQSFQTQFIVSFAIEQMFKLFSWKLCCVIRMNNLKLIFLTKLPSSISTKSDAFRFSNKLYCDIFTNETFSCLIINIELEVSIEKLIYLNMKNKFFSLFFEYDIRCDFVHVIFLNEYKCYGRSQGYLRVLA